MKIDYQEFIQSKTQQNTGNGFEHGYFHVHTHKREYRLANMMGVSNIVA